MTQKFTHTHSNPSRRRNKPGAPICGAPKRGGRGPCESPVIYANGRCWLHNGKAKRGPGAPRFKHGSYVRFPLIEKPLGALYREMVRKRLILALIKTAVTIAFNRLGIPDLIPYVLAEIGCELRRLEQEVESGTELRPPRPGRRATGRVSQEQIEQLRKRVAHEWGGGGSKRSRPGRKLKRKSIELEAEPEATHTEFEVDRETLERMSAAVRGAMADREAANNR